MTYFEDKEQQEAREWISDRLNSHLLNGKVDKAEEAHVCKVNPSTVSNWANKRKDQYNLPAWALLFSNVGDVMLEDIAFRKNKMLIDLPTGMNGKTDDEREATLRAMAKMQTCEDAKGEAKEWRKIFKLAQRALKELGE